MVHRYTDVLFGSGDLWVVQHLNGVHFSPAIGVIFLTPSQDPDSSLDLCVEVAHLCKAVIAEGPEDAVMVHSVTSSEELASSSSYIFTPLSFFPESCLRISILTPTDKTRLKTVRSRSRRRVYSFQSLHEKVSDVR